MATKGMKIWGTTGIFDGVTIGEITNVGEGSRTRELIEVFSCDSANEAVEKLSSGIDEGELPLTCIYDGEVAGSYHSLDTKFAAGTSGTLTITFKNGSTMSATALIRMLGTPGGPARGGIANYNITFAISGAWTHTGHA